MSQLYRTFIGVLFIALTACVPVQTGTIAGNDEDRDIGLGGTGMLADTGNGLGGTGIVGEITGFGSIFVNGIEIEYNDETPFVIDGKAASLSQLAKGDMVEVLTTNASMHTRAQRIKLRHEVIGIVDSVDAEAMRFTVHGQTVLIENTAAELPKTGASVAVAGVRINQHTVLATRVTRAEAGASLVRSANTLPFAKQAVRWLVQANIHNGEAAFELDGRPHVVSVDMPATGDTVTILELIKNSRGQLRLERTINPADTPQGREWQDPAQRIDNRMQHRSSPMRMNMDIRPGMNRAGG